MISEQGRQALIVALAQRASLGRTAVMKLMFFLQELRGVPLSYNFRIYTYGPYDRQVLEDLRLTEAHGGILCNKIIWSGGSGVEISTGANAAEILLNSQALIASVKIDLDWVVSEFGKKTASDLEILSTIIFIDRDFEKCIEPYELATTVHTVKPHHDLGKISVEVENLNKQGFLRSLC